MTLLSKTSALLVLLLGASLNSTASGQRFTNPVRVATPVDPDSIISGDLNGDGRTDLIWFQVSYTGSVGHILLAQPGGGYATGQTFSIPGAITGVPSCATADVTRDGRVDLICATMSYSTSNATVLVFPGNGDGTLGTAVATQYGSQYGSGVILALVGDLNGDGVPDFLLEDAYYTPALVLLSDGHGGFLPTKTVPNSYNYDVPVAADINGDGILDILWPNGAGVALGKGDGSFGSLLSPYPVGHGPVTCAFHDMDGDGKLDAVCGYLANGNGAGTAVDILHGNGDGTFNPNPIAHTAFGNSLISRSGTGDFLAPEMIRDLNGDGIPDILAFAGDGLTVLLGQAGLTFSPPLRFALANSGYEFDIRTSMLRQYVDLNGDGLLDVLAAGPNGLYLLYGHADGSFGSAAAFKVSEVSGEIVIADFNGDGKPDLVSTGAPQTSLSLGKGDGTFAAPINIPGAPFTTGAPIFAADFNGDGKPDLLSFDSSNTYLMLGKGDGTFASPITATGVPTVINSYSITDNSTVRQEIAADLNSDGKADFFSINTNSQSQTYSLVSALSRGDGTFQSVSTSYVAPVYNSSFYFTPVAPAVGDFAHSGHLDAAYYMNEGVYVVRGNGDGSFSPTPSVLPTPVVNGVQAGAFEALQTADIDGDGNLDIVFLSWYPAVQYSYQDGPSCVFIYYGKGDGTFTPATQAGCFNHAYTDLRVSDVSGDGRPDIILQTGSSLNNYVVGEIDNLGGRAFGSEINYTAGSLSGDLIVADLNRDGRPDLVFGNQRYEAGYSANSVTVLLNESTTTATGTLTSAPNPSYVGQGFMLTATLTPPATGTLYAGNITFSVDGTVLGTVPLSGNVATIAGPTNLSAGVHQLSANWPGDANDPSLAFYATHTVLLYPLQMSLSCTPNPSLLGQSIALMTQFVSIPPFGVPASSAPYTGTLSFYDSSTLLEQQQVANAGFNFNTAGLSGGAHTLMANYSSDGVYAPATASCSEVVTKLPTSSQLSQPPGPVAGVPFHLTATVKPASSTTLSPTGTVTFLVDGSAVGMGMVDPASGIATFNDSGLAGGNHSITCSYGGDNTFQGSACPAASASVTAAPSVLGLTSTPNPAYGETPITITANLSGNGQPVAGASVIFGIYVGSSLMGQATVNTDAFGNAVYTNPGLPPGSYTITASFAGNASVQQATATPVAQRVILAPTATTLTASPNPAYLGQIVTLTATVVSTVASPNHPSGPVAFLDGTTTLGFAVPNGSGVATLTTSTLSVGTHSLTAGSSTSFAFQGSLSNTVSEVIVASGFTIALAPSTLTIGHHQAGTTEILLASVGNFSGPLTLTYGALPQYGVAKIAPATVTLVSGGAVSSTLTLNTLQTVTATNPTRPGETASVVYAAGLLMLLPFVFSRRKRLYRALAIFAMALALQGLTGCVNSYYSLHFVEAGTYTLPVTATDGNGNSQTTNLTFVVAP